MSNESMGRGPLLVLLTLNGVMFVVELIAGWGAESMGLIADGLDMGADAAVFTLALLAIGTTPAKKLRAASFAGWVQLALALLAIAEVARRFVLGSAPEPPVIVGVSLVALVVNVICLALLRKQREGEVHLQAAWIFSATDVQANLGVLAAGLLVQWTGSPIPDLLIGLVVCGLVLRGALRIRRRVRASALAAAAVVMLALPSGATAQQGTQDWANLRRYQAANAALGAPAAGESRVVFYGNSITEGWAPLFATMFPGKPYIGRGISGQTTPQLLVRFHQDVVALRPKVVVILAGTNDIAGNTGPSTLGMIEDNLEAMTEIAKQHGIRVVLSSVLPVYDYPWKPGLEPAPKIIALNAWMRRYAAEVGETYLDYHTAMADARGGLPPALAADGVHPTLAGYRVMAPLAEAAIARALAR